MPVFAWITGSMFMWLCPRPFYPVLFMNTVRVTSEEMYKYLKNNFKKLLKLSPEQWNVTVPINWRVGKCHYAKFSRSRLEACGRIHLISAFSSELLRLLFAVTSWCSLKSWPYCALCQKFGIMRKVNVMFFPFCLHSSLLPVLQNSLKPINNQQFAMHFVLHVGQMPTILD